MSVNELYFCRGNTKRTQRSDELQKWKRQYFCKFSRHSLKHSHTCSNPDNISLQADWHTVMTLCLYVWRSSIWFFLFSLICSLSLWTVCLLLTVRFFLQFLLCLTMQMCVLLWFRERELFCEGACHTDHTHTHSWENRHLSAVCHQRSYVMEYVSVRAEGTDPGFLT